MNDENPAAIATAASDNGTPALRAALRKASCNCGCSWRSLRYRTLNWIAKSTPSPTNSTKNAIEIRLKAPTRNNPAAAEIAKPNVRVTMTAAMVRIDRSASHRMTRTSETDTAMVIPAFWLIVPNWSSSIGISPVWRTRAWNAMPRSRSDAMREIASVAA